MSALGDKFMPWSTAAGKFRLAALRGHLMGDAPEVTLKLLRDARYAYTRTYEGQVSDWRDAKVAECDAEIARVEMLARKAG